MNVFLLKKKKKKQVGHIKIAGILQSPVSCCVTASRHLCVLKEVTRLTNAIMQVHNVSLKESDSEERS